MAPEAEHRPSKGTAGGIQSIQVKGWAGRGILFIQTWPASLMIFTKLAHWADSVSKSRCLSVVSVGVCHHGNPASWWTGG